MINPFDDFFNETHPKGKAVWESEDDDIPLYDDFDDKEET